MICFGLTTKVNKSLHMIQSCNNVKLTLSLMKTQETRPMKFIIALVNPINKTYVLNRMITTHIYSVRTIMTDAHINMLTVFVYIFVLLFSYDCHYNLCIDISHKSFMDSQWCSCVTIHTCRRTQFQTFSVEVSLHLWLIILKLSQT